MSRKLVFASGLLRCFFCHLDPQAAAARETLREPQHDVTKLLAYMENALSQTPLELLARAAKGGTIPSTTPAKLFNSYDRFLSILDDEETRKKLEKMSEGEMARSPIWNEIRELSHDFHAGLTELFFGNDEGLRELTMQYGLF